MLSWLKQERLGEKSYFSWLGIDLLDHLVKFTQLQAITTRRLGVPRPQTAFCYNRMVVAMNETYVVRYRYACLHFYVRNSTENQGSVGLQNRHQVAGRHVGLDWITEIGVELRGHLARYHQRKWIYTYNFLTRRFTKIRCHFPDIIDRKSHYSGARVWGNFVLVKRRDSLGQLSLCLVNMDDLTTFETVYDQLSNWAQYQMNEKYVVVASDRPGSQLRYHQFYLYDRVSKTLRQLTFQQGNYFQARFFQLYDNCLFYDGQNPDRVDVVKVVDVTQDQVVDVCAISNDFPGPLQRYFFWQGDQRKLYLYTRVITEVELEEIIFY